MRIRFTLSLLLAFVMLQLQAQVVTTNPAFVTESGAIEVTFDATKGTGGMVGATDCYAHIGVITGKSSSNADWKYVKAGWSENIEACKLLNLGSNKWKLTITPDIRGYFGITDSEETIYKVAMVFRNGNGSKEGKDSGGADIIVNVYEPGLNVSILTPTNNAITTPEATVNFSLRTSQQATLNFYINDVNTTPVKSVANASELTHAQKYAAGNYYLIAEAVNANGTSRDTAYICSRKENVKQQRPLGLKDGITFNNDGSVTFCFYGADKQHAYLLGDFNDFRPNNGYLMNQDNVGNFFLPDNYYWITLSGLDPNFEYAFQYLVDGTIRVGDAYCEKILDPSNDKWINEKAEIYPNLRPYPMGRADEILSVFKINQTPYNWQVTDFKAPAQDELVIYELLFRDFTEEGSIRAAIEKLDYLKGLGINAIELMPIHEFDGNDSWGYNPNFFFAPDKAYGTKEDYKRFVDECHKRGMAVIVDVVFNHAWGQSPMVKLWWDAAKSQPTALNPFCNPVAPHPYSVGSDFNHDEPRVREHFKRAIKFWLEEYKLDGYRFDLSKGFTQTKSGDNVGLWGRRDDKRISHIKEYVDAMKEVNPNSYPIMEHFADNDEEDILAAHRGTMLWRGLHHNFGNVQKGSNSDLSGIRGYNRVGYMESHDEERQLYMAQTGGTAPLKASLEARLKQNAALAAFAYLSPGPRMLWMFGEMGYDINIDFNGRTGRKPVLWNYLDQPVRKTLVDTYSKILTLRRDNPEAFNSNVAQFNWSVGSNDWAAGKRMAWSHNDLSIVVVGNFQDATTTVAPGFGKTGLWYNWLTGEELNVTNTAMTLPLEANGLLIFTTQKPTSVEAPASVKLQIYPNPASDYLHIAAEGDLQEVTLYTLQGARIATHRAVETINLSGLTPGYYLVEVVVDGNRTTTRFIKR